MKRTLPFVIALALLAATSAHARLREKALLCWMYPSYPGCSSTPHASEPPTGGPLPPANCVDNPAACTPPTHPAYIVPGTPRTLIP